MFASECELIADVFTISNLVEQCLLRYCIRVIVVAISMIGIVFVVNKRGTGQNTKQALCYSVVSAHAISSDVHYHVTYSLNSSHC